MKKVLKIFASIIAGLIALIIAAMILVPVLFKKQIKEVVVRQINEMVNARVEVGDYSLGFFKNFPNLSFRLKNVSVIGIEEFEADTLADIRSLAVVFNLRSLFSKEGYEVKSVIIERPVVHAIVLSDGTVNWDIMKLSDSAEESPVTPESATEPSGEEMRFLLRKFLVNHGNVFYRDDEMNMTAEMFDLNLSLSGDMTESETDLLIEMNIAAMDLVYEGTRYLSSAVADSKMDLFADLDNWVFTFRYNYLTINDLVVNFAGTVTMPEDDIHTEITFTTPDSDFKSLLSMVPAVYMTDFEGLTADGTFDLNGSLSGTYSSADSTYPDAKISMAVRNGVISYPDLPEKITAISMEMDVDFDGTDMDKTVVSLPAFHFELAGNPFDLSMLLKTPMSDPDIKGSAKGKIDFGSLAQAIPLDDMTLSGILETSLSLAGRMSMIEEERYQEFHAEGSMILSNFIVEMTDMPQVAINKASFEFNPAFANLREANIRVGKNTDFAIDGKLSNYLPYLFSDGTISGNLNLRSSLIDVDEIMAALPEEIEEDTTALALVVIPSNIDFTFIALIDKMVYGSLKPENIRGTMIVRDGMLTVSNTGMDIMGGKISMNALYDTRDSLKPIMKADMSITNMLVKNAFETFNAVQKLAPAARGIEGAVNMTLKFESLLGSDMMPLLNTVFGEGILTSSELQIVDAPTFNKIREVLKINDKYSNTFKDLRASFRVRDGRVFLTPFDTKMGNVKMNISGDQGFDQTLNYFIKTEIPRADLGSLAGELTDNLVSQASKLGITYTPSEIIKINLKVGGTVLKPEILPDFGGAGAAASSAVSALKEQVRDEVKETVTEAVTEVTDKARAEAEVQAARIMKEAEEKAQMIRDEAAKAADKLKAEAEEQAQRIIKEAEGKNAILKAAANRSADALRNEANRKADQLVSEADVQAQKLLDEAAVKRDEILKKI
ncbi:MAG: AsmA-like C-terminal region-containing protein [Bacteroidales bacterium]